MSNIITKIVIASAAILGASSAAHAASDDFTARFNYDAAISASDNLQKFEIMAENVCDAQMSRAGYRTTEGRFQRRKCKTNLMKQAVKATKNDALTLVYAQTKTQRPNRKTSATLLAQK